MNEGESSMMRRIATPGWFLVVSLSGALLDQGTWAVTDKKVSVSSSTAAYDQRESAIAMRAAESGLESGVLCSVWIDASVSTNQLRYGYSTDGGFNWNDGGALPAASSHIPLFDPDVAFRLLDKKFYITGIDRVTVSGGF